MGNFVIAITRMAGSGGTTISKMLAEELGVSVYSKENLCLCGEDVGFNAEMFENCDPAMKETNLYKAYKAVYNGENIPKENGNYIADKKHFEFQSKALRELTKMESYVCIGRACDHVLKGSENVLKVFIYAPVNICCERESKRLGMTIEEAKRMVREKNEQRREFYIFHTGKKWEELMNYDICLNTASLTYSECVEMIKKVVKERYM